MYENTFLSILIACVQIQVVNLFADYKGEIRKEKNSSHCDNKSNVLSAWFHIVTQLFKFIMLTFSCGCGLIPD